MAQCERDNSLVCMTPDDAVALRLYIGSLERSITSLAGCPWIDWWAPPGP